MASVHYFDLLVANLVLQLRDFVCLVDLAPLLLDSSLLVKNIDIDDVVLVELLGPPFRNPVLDLLLEDLLVGAL